MTLSTRQRNMLGDSASPYLQQHKDNPVHWQEWNAETLEYAKGTNRPILLSVGYAACHWCHVMAHESFEDPETAKLMNDHFINIKVDREERPDVDQIYMAALHALGEQGGWPLTMFLMPDGSPFWGGTYFPPKPSHGRPAFIQVLEALSKAFKQNSEDVNRNSSALIGHLKNLKPNNVSRETPNKDIYEQFQERAIKLYDSALGGIKGAPKFPNAPILEAWARAANGDPKNHFGKAFLNTIERISNGGIYDHLAGGIARYSVDQYWLVPHFEKMLYDNAHYIRHLSIAYRMTGGELFEQRALETVNWLTQEMSLDDGTFASSLDADTDGEEGKYYVWKAGEIEAILGPEFETFSSAFALTSEGNWEGKTILNRLHGPIGNFESESNLEAAKTQLLKHREQRTKPDRDGKSVTDWNGYLIRALCEAGQTFSKPEWIEIAKRSFHYITESNLTPFKVPHTRLGGRASEVATATDIASLVNASLTIFEFSANEHYLEVAKTLLETLDKNYSDNLGSYYLTNADVNDLIIRPSCDLDEANPSGASQILEAQIRYANLASDPVYLQSAERLISSQQAVSRESPYGMAGFANALHEWFTHRHVRIFANNDFIDSFKSVLETVSPLSISVSTADTSSHLGVQLPENKEDGFAVVCQGQTCSLPIRTPTELREYLSNTHKQ